MNTELNKPREFITSPELLPEIISYRVYYSGDLISPISKIPQASVVILSPYDAVIFVKRGYESLITSLPNINILEPENDYILTEVSPIESANITQFTEGEPLFLTGTGVIVGIVDTGIDYLNKEFIREDDTSRILSIWDQTDNTGTPPTSIGYGSEHSNSQINEALKVNREGGDPYTVVPERDIDGHGTHSAGIIGARGYGDVKGAAPNCDFIVVKLRPFGTFEVTPGNPSDNISTYRNTDIAIATFYLFEQRKIYNRPMVIFLPVSAQIGGHDGTNPLEQLIDYYSYISDITFALGTGNQGNSQTHASGTLEFSGDKASVDLQVGNNQSSLFMSIWSYFPDKLSFNLTSPSGQVTAEIPARIDQVTEINFIYENTTVVVNYFFPKILSGDEQIRFSFTDMSPGIWKITILGNYIVNGNYNVWISQRPLSRPGTLLLNSDNFTTLAIPSTSHYAITTACYNQSTNTIWEKSGVGFTALNNIKPEITCGGINVLTTSLNNTTTTVSGSSAATAVLAGAIALLYQWGIVDRNLPNMSSEIIKAFLIRGTRKRPGEGYPSPYWGYGILDMRGVFDAIRGIYNYQDQLGTFPSRCCDDIIEVSLPLNIFNRIEYH